MECGVDQENLDIAEDSIEGNGEHWLESTRKILGLKIVAQLKGVFTLDEEVETQIKGLRKLEGIKVLSRLDGAITHGIGRRQPAGQNTKSVTNKLLGPRIYISKDMETTMGFGAGTFRS